MKYTYHIQKLAPQPVMSIRDKLKIDTYNTMVAEYLEEIWKYIETMGGEVVGPPFTRCHNNIGDIIDIETGVPVYQHIQESEHIRKNTLPGGETAVTLHYGPYDFLPELVQALQKWAAKNERVSSGPAWQVHCSNPGEEPDPANWKTEIYLPLL